jgi:hypothetical protein
LKIDSEDLNPTMKSMRILFFLLPLLFLLPSAGAQTFVMGIDVDNPPEGVFSDEWSEMYINGEKVGYTHTVLKREGNNILTLEDSSMEMGRGDTSISTISTSRTLEAIDGTPISMISITREGERTKTQKFHFTPEGVDVTTTDGTRTWTRQVSLEPGYLLSWSFVRELEMMDPQPGSILESRIYTPDIVLDQTLPVTTKFIGREEISLSGKTYDATKIEQTIQIGFLPLTLTAWIKENGNLLKLEMPIGRMQITLIGSTEEKAKASFTPPDLFTDTLISLNRAIPTDADIVTFSVGSQGDLMQAIPESAYQSVRKLDDGSFEVRVVRGKLRFEEPTEVDEVYLQPSPLVDFEDPAIIDLLDKAEMDKLSPEDQVRKLVEITDNAISIKSMDMGFATASETVALSEGDCTEHALLLTALGRAAGFPTRGAAGVVYFETSSGKPVMGYHMWAQIWNGRSWLDIDAAFGTAETAPIRVLFSTTDLTDPTLSEEVLSLVQYLGQTTISITEIETEE